MPRQFESYRLSRRAEIDLAEIYTYSVAQWAVERANRYVDDIREAIEGLVAGTKIGRSRGEVAAAYLCYRVGTHMIFYRETEYIIVVRILHGSMDLPRYLAP